MTKPHSTSLYVPSGRGIIYVAKWNGTTPPEYPTNIKNGLLGDFIDIGNAPSFEVEPSTEKRPHYSSREGINLKDLNPITTLEYSINFTLDEIAAKNLEMFLLGDYDESTGIIKGLQNADAEYAIIFVSNNPIGPQSEGYFRRCSISPNGPFQLIGNDYLVLSYTAEGLADVENNSSSPYFDYKIKTTTTTSTTTTTTTTTTA